MKNKFKKSKIIVPALALITATTAASVTGTVAWFTAARTATVNAGDFIATKLESNLTVKTEGRIGTAASTNNTAITTTTSDNYTNKLTHGSYDAQKSAAGSLYVAKVSDDGTEIESFTDLGIESKAKVTTPTTTSTKWMARSDKTTTTNIWYGVSWTMTFKLDSASSNTADYLFLDVKNSTFTDKSGKTTTTTKEGFRIAFMTTDKFMVLGGDDTVTHVGETATASPVKYEKYTKDTNYFVAGSDVSKVSDVTLSADGVETTLSGSVYSLGKVDETDGLEVTCVAWYEGSDSHVADELNDSSIDMSTISAELNFYTRGVIA